MSGLGRVGRTASARLVLAAVVLVLSACQVNVAVDLDVAEDGSGTVTVEADFDAAANEAMGGVAAQLRLDDLDAADWDLIITDDDAGGVTITAAKAVTSADQWQSVLDEVAGPGVFTGVDVAVADGRQQLAFEIDLRDGWQLFADDEVTAALDGEPFGAPIDSLTEGRSLDEIVDVDVLVSVRNQSDGVPTAASFSPRFDDETPTTVGAVATEENSMALLLRWIAIALMSLFVLATVLAITGIVLQRRSDRLRPNPTPASIASRVPGSASASTPTAAPGAVSSTAEPVRLLVIEPLGVLYDQAQPFERELLPFVRRHGGSARADTIADGYGSLLAGSMDTGAFWELCGISLPRDEADGLYVERRRLRSGAGNFFEEMQRRRIPIAATTNDAARWSAAIRERDRLSVVWPWLVSAEVGALTDNPGMFEVLRRESGIAHSHCLYVDTDIDSLDAAAELGMKTVLFDTGDLDLPAIVGHVTVTDLRDLFAGERV